MKKIMKYGGIFVFLFFSGCSVKHLEKSADREVYGIIEEKKIKMADDAVPEKFSVLDERTAGETTFIRMKDAIVLAAGNNKSYKSRREDVYLNMLDLTYQRYTFRTNYSLTGNTSWDKGEDESISGGLNLRLFRWLAKGAQITLDISKDFIKYFTGDRDKDLQTIIALNIIQPLLKGSGQAIAQEDLLQAERAAVYSIRNFIRYQNSFSVDTSERFLKLLLSKNNTENIYTNYESLKNTRERIEMLAQAGRQPSYQVDQARQSELAAYQRWINAQNSHTSSLDNFKVFLGLPVEANLLLDDKLLEHLIDVGIEKPDIRLSEFIDIALKKRLDLLTAYDGVEDAKRKINVALNNLKPKVNLELSANSATESKPYPNLDFEQPSYHAGLVFDLPLDRLPDRNSYKRALISLNRKQREFEESRDNIILEVVQQYRNLEEFYQSYLIQLNSLKLAEKRIESTNLLLQAGRATTRDLLDAEESYLNAKNALASSVINYIVSYLKFLYSAECLELDDSGMWKGDLYEKITKEFI
ncbi:MAG TPA: TolC family protein [bacterium]|nr:TolC family protein [bacterium]